MNSILLLHAHLLDTFSPVDLPKRVVALQTNDVDTVQPRNYLFWAEIFGEWAIRLHSDEEREATKHKKEENKSKETLPAKGDSGDDNKESNESAQVKSGHTEKASELLHHHHHSGVGILSGSTSRVSKMFAVR